MELIDLDQAQRVLEAAMQKSEEIGVPMSIAIVDEGRELLLFARQRGAVLGSIEVAIGKAYTARTLDMSTVDIGPMTQPGQPLFGLETTHQRPLVTFAGGRPLQVGDVIVGAVGASGGTPEQDDEVAAAGVAALSQA